MWWFDSPGGLERADEQKTRDWHICFAVLTRLLVGRKSIDSTYVRSSPSSWFSAPHMQSPTRTRRPQCWVWCPVRIEKLAQYWEMHFNIRGGRIGCFVRRIWGHKISFFVLRPRDVAHPGSGPAQAGSGLAQVLLRLTHPKSHFRKAAPQHEQLLQV